MRTDGRRGKPTAHDVREEHENHDEPDRQQRHAGDRQTVGERDVKGVLVVAEQEPVKGRAISNRAEAPSDRSATKYTTWSKLSVRRRSLLNGHNSRNASNTWMPAPVSATRSQLDQMAIEPVARRHLTWPPRSSEH